MPGQIARRAHPTRSRHAAAALTGAAALLLATTAANAAPPIRTTAGGPVPACVTPERLDAFLAHHNRARGYTLAPRFRGIARWYATHGDRHQVRWDYAFFQMLLETNFLSYRRGNGQWGDVNPNQNNFAGLGTTGGGVPGDSYPDVSTGVLAQIQHLVVYSGERLANPVGHRTRLKQDVILKSVALIVAKRPVTFADLARRWAVDPHYARSIERLATLFRAEHCGPGSRGATRPASTSSASAAPPPPPRSRPAQPAGNPQLATGARDCRVRVASYGDGPTLLIESLRGDTLHLTALGVIAGFEQSLAESFIATYAPAGRTLADFPSSDTAIAEAHAICARIVNRS